MNSYGEKSHVAKIFREYGSPLASEQGEQGDFVPFRAVRKEKMVRPCWRKPTQASNGNTGWPLGG
jgi:hypothetical protein